MQATHHALSQRTSFLPLLIQLRHPHRPLRSPRHKGIDFQLSFPQMISLLLPIASLKHTAMHACRPQHSYLFNDGLCWVSCSALNYSKLSYYSTAVSYIFAFQGLGLHSRSLCALLINVLLFTLVLSMMLPRYQYSNKHELQYCMKMSLLSYILPYTFRLCCLCHPFPVSSSSRISRLSRLLPYLKF